MPWFSLMGGKFKVLSSRFKVAAQRDARSLIQIQRLIEKMLQMGEDGGVGDDQGCAGGATGGLQLGLPFVRKGNNREMAGVRVSFQLGDGVGHLAIARKKVGKNEQGIFLLGASDQRSGAGDGQHTVVEI